MNAKTVRVGDLMNRDVKSIDKNTTIIAAAKQMIEEHVSSFIIEPDNELDAFGIITRKDVVETLITAGAGEASIRVKDVMTKPSITVNPQLSIYNCHQMMLMVGVRRMPVVDGNTLVGIISNSDILRSIVGGKL
jgi:CBS domain-containing protein